MNCMGVWVRIQGSEFEQLVSAVKSRILDFVLSIEEENPQAGEAPTNTEPVPKERLQALVNNFFGPVGNVAQNSAEVSQIAHMGPEDLQSLRKLVDELNEHLHELSLDASTKQNAQAQIAVLGKELSGDPDPAVVRRVGRTLRGILEGAIGSLLATAVAQPSAWAWVKSTLDRLFG